MESPPRAHAPRLSSDEIEQELARLAGWREEESALTRTFRFADFRSAIAFIAAAAVDAERLDHHPEWRNVFDRVQVRLTTHDTVDGEPGVTRLDLELARRMDALAEEIQRRGLTPSPAG